MPLKKLFQKKKCRKSEEEYHRQSLSAIAFKPASVNTELLASQVKDTILTYITAFLNLDPDALPMNHMEEQFFYEAERRIYVEADHLMHSNINCRTVNQVLIDTIFLEEYDNSLYYVVGSLTYRISFQATGDIIQNDQKEPFRTSRTLLCQFDNDARMGWILSKVKELTYGEYIDAE